MAIIATAITTAVTATASFLSANASWLVPTVGLIGIAAGTTGGIVGGVEGHNQAKQQAKTAEENARLQQQQMEYNKRMELREAAAIEAENAENVRRQREETARLKASQLAMLGKSGVAMASGSPLAVLGATAADEELKIQDAHYSASRVAAAHRTKATDYGFGSSIAGHNALAAKASRPSGASLAGNILGEVGSAAFKTGSVVMSAASAMKK